MTTDPYVDPDRGLLRNRLGIADAQRLREVEAGLTLAALADLGSRVLPGTYDLAHLQGFHREIFGDLYPWAGEIRVVGIARSDPFFRQLSREAGWPIDWSGLDPDENESASRASLRGDNGPLRALLDATLPLP
jgi:fido (protein-threonine AMPylation protein)